MSPAQYAEMQNLRLDAFEVVAMNTRIAEMAEDDE